MKGLMQTVREALDEDCLENGGLNKLGCKVSLSGSSRPHLTVDFDKPTGTVAVGVSGHAGTLVAEQFVPSDEQVRFRPAAVVGSILKAERNRFKDRGGKIRFIGCAEAVRLMSCGASLAGVLNQ